MRCANSAGVQGCSCTPWQKIQAFFAQRLERLVKAGKKIDDVDLFGPIFMVAVGDVFDAGRPSLPTRLMVALLTLKHAVNESDSSPRKN
jgi:IS5 family transposase